MVQISHPPCVVTSILANLFALGAIGMVTISPHTAVAGSHALAHSGSPLRIKPITKPRLDFSGRTRIGIASFYADRLAGRKMANGVKMNPLSDNAASRTLPLGTLARVTNLRNHKSAVVSIQDRGPYIQGRIVDLSPSTAREIGITREMGIAKVRVTPITIPPV
jgi:rare lipoprotein A